MLCSSVAQTQYMLISSTQMKIRTNKKHNANTQPNTKNNKQQRNWNEFATFCSFTVPHTYTTNGVNLSFVSLLFSLSLLFTTLFFKIASNGIIIEFFILVILGWESQRIKLDTPNSNEKISNRSSKFFFRFVTVSNVTVYAE